MGALRQSKPAIFILVFSAATAVICGLVFMNIAIKNYLSISTFNTLAEIGEQQAFNFTSELAGKQRLITAFADVVAMSDLSDTESLVPVLSTLIKDSTFELMGFADLNGHAVLNNGEHIDVTDREYFRQSRRGQPCITEPLKSRLRDRYVIVFSAPVYLDNRVVGVLFGSYSEEELNKLFLSSFSGTGYAFITTNEGLIIAESKNPYTLIEQSKNLFDAWSTMDFFEGDSFDTILKKVHVNGTGMSEYRYKGQTRLMYYTTIGINSWNLFTVAPAEFVNSVAENIANIVYTLTASCIVLFLVMLIWILRMQKTHIVELSNLAFVDAVTGAPTLAKFKQDAVSRLAQYPDLRFVLIMNDIDRFKLINQTLGFETGDRVLTNMGIALRASLGPRDLYARANIDEYVLLCEYISDEDLAAKNTLFTDTFNVLMGSSFAFTVSFPTGLYFIKPTDRNNINIIIEKANIAHRKAKELGVQHCIFDDKILQDELRIKDLENHMEAALANNEFHMYLQAKRNLSDESLAGAEALVRWHTKDDGVVSPGLFIPVFEKNGFIQKLDMYMFEQACKFLRQIIDSGKKPFTISVNFSRQHLRNEYFVQNLIGMAARFSVPPEYLEIELTETAIFDNVDILQSVLNRLHNAGFTLSMDDFGTGYSSLGLLKNLSVDVIKIDRSFFVNANDSGRARIVLTNVIRMAKELGIHTVAEGVEYVDQITLLRELGCDVVQGYYYAKPAPAMELERILQ